LPVFLGDIDSPERLGLILAFYEPPMQLADILFGVGFILCVLDAVNPGTGVLSQTPKYASYNFSAVIR
jgi:hypothetical protein